MIKKYGWKYFIDYYRLTGFGVAALLLLILRGPITDLICSGTDDLDAFSYALIRIATPIFLWAVWFLLFFINCRDRSYRYKTGRNYEKDYHTYQRTYASLVEYFKDAEPHKLDTSTFPEESWHNAYGLIFGRDKGRLISIPSASECNVAVFGPPGSGKTSGIAIPDAMRFQGSVLAIDVKGDLYNYVHTHSKRKIVRFAPDAPDSLKISWHFDPFEGISDMNETDRKLYIESMATVLIPDEGGNDGNYFTTRGRKLFQGITHLLLFENPDANFPDVIHSILQGNVFDWVKKAIASDCMPAKELLASFYGNNEKNVSGAYDAVTTALVHFSNPILDELLTKGLHTVSIKTLESGIDVYLQIQQEHLDAYAPLFTLLIQSFSTAFTKRPDSSTGAKNRPILMLLDEFPQLTFSYKMINSNLSTLRSKSIICLLIQQNMAQLETRYKPAGARSLIGNCNYQVILGSNDITSNKMFSDMFGQKKILKVSNSITHSNQISSGKSITETETRVFPPEVFGDLPAESKEILYFKGKYAELTKINCYKD